MISFVMQKEISTCVKGLFYYFVEELALISEQLSYFGAALCRTLF